MVDVCNDRRPKILSHDVRSNPLFDSNGNMDAMTRVFISGDSLYESLMSHESLQLDFSSVDPFDLNSTSGGSSTATSRSRTVTRAALSTPPEVQMRPWRDQTGHRKRGRVWPSAIFRSCPAPPLAYHLRRMVRPLISFVVNGNRKFGVHVKSPDWIERTAFRVRRLWRKRNLASNSGGRIRLFKEILA